MINDTTPAASGSPTDSDVATRIEAITQNADLSWVVVLLGERRDEILTRWLRATADQPLHGARAKWAVADHVPHLFDALVVLLSRYSDPSRNAGVPLEDPDVLAAAQSHARVRFEQGFLAPDVVTEFRILRQEIGRALRSYVADGSPTSDVIGAELLLHDALDGAVFLALTTLNQHEVARRQAEITLEEERAVAAGERLAFFATLGHDLKNPLTVAIGVVQLLRRQEQGGRLAPEQLGERLQSIESAMRRSALRVDELMDLARRNDAEVMALHLAPVDLVGLVREVLDAYRVADVRHEIILAPSSGSLVGSWDRDRLERSVDNLVNNALKFSPDGGRVSAAVSEQGTGAGREAILTVTDEGLGIPEDEREEIFERFGRGSNVAGMPGSGLGLWSVRRIVEQHGGTLSATSRIGKGSEFTLRLPIIEPASPDQEHASSPGTRAT
ncbi:MAG: hypothetical protein NVS9B6_08860 [Candidatus Limnocylindrales bacterium]